MLNTDNYWYRIIFRLRVYEKHGEGFQSLFNDIMHYTHTDFESVAPWGNWGDGGNDGWIRSQGTYFQCYGMKPATITPVDAVQKSTGDFLKLKAKWPAVINYYFVYNDRYTGLPGPVGVALAKLKSNHSLSDAGGICAPHLEEYFMNLADDKKMMIVGSVPQSVPEKVDPTAVGQLLRYLADKPADASSLLKDGQAPNFEKKILLNQVTPPVSEALRLYSYQTHEVDVFFKGNGVGMAQHVAEELRSLYDESKSEIPDSAEDAPNLRYYWLIEKLVPPAARQHIHTMKAYRIAAQAVLSKYFESCDVYDHPQHLASS